MRRIRYKIIEPKLPHLITCTVLHWIAVLTRSATVDIVPDSLRYLMADRLTAYAYVILANHLHLMVQSERLDTGMARFKSYTAKKYAFPRRSVGTR